jgi:hypothetical protein
MAERGRDNKESFLSDDAGQADAFTLRLPPEPVALDDLDVGDFSRGGRDYVTMLGSGMTKND